MFIDIALVVAAAAEDAVPVAAMSICDMFMFANKASSEGEEAEMVRNWEACGQE